MIAWFDPELLFNDDALFGLFRPRAGIGLFTAILLKKVNNRPYVLPAEQEALLAGAGEIPRRF